MSRLFKQPAGPAKSVGLVFGTPAFAPRRPAQGLIEIGVMYLHVVDDLEVFFLDPGEVDALDMDQPQQLAHRLGHRTPTLVARAAALRDADHGPEFLLVHAEAPADFSRVDELKKLHSQLQHSKYW